jgi:tetratricopeptide (TPR) repeat protein
MKMKKTSGLFLVLACLLLLPTLSRSICEDIPTRKNIQLAERATDFDTKIEHYVIALETCPGDVDILSIIIDLCIENEQFDNAYGFLDKKLAINTYDVDSFYKLAYVYMMWEDYEKAEETAKKALNINSYYIDCYILLGDVKYYSRSYKEAMGYYQKVLELDTNNIKAFLKIADIFYLFEKYDKVALYIDKAIEVEKTDELVLLKKMIKGKMQNDYDQVKESAEALLEADPNNLMALKTLSMSMLENEKEKSECLKLLTKAYHLEKQPFMKSKVEHEIEKIVNSIAASK